MSTPTGHAAPATERWRMLLPPGWATLTTDPGRAPGQIKALLDEMMAGRPRDELILVRIEADRQLRELARLAALAGARDLHFQLDPVAGAPVSASLVVSEFVAPDDDALAAEVARIFADNEGVQDVGTVRLGNVTAVRRRRRARRDGFDLETDATAWQTSVEYVVDLGEGRLVALVFSTSTEPVVDEVVELFDAVAGTFEVL